MLSAERIESKKLADFLSEIKKPLPVKVKAFSLIKFREFFISFAGFYPITDVLISDSNRSIFRFRRVIRLSPKNHLCCRRATKRFGLTV